MFHIPKWISSYWEVLKWKFLVLIFKGLFVKKQSYKVSPTQFWRWNSCGHLAIGAERGWYDLDPAEQANEAVGAHSSLNLPQGVMFINYKPIKNDWVIKKNTIMKENTSYSFSVKRENRHFRRKKERIHFSVKTYLHSTNKPKRRHYQIWAHFS